MTRPRQAPRDPNEPSYGKIMTGLLIPRDARSNPRRVLSGLAFIVFVAFFVFAAMGRACRHETPPAAPPTAAAPAVPASPAVPGPGN